MWLSVFSVLKTLVGYLGLLSNWKVNLWVLQVPFSKFQLVYHVPFAKKWLASFRFLVPDCWVLYPTNPRKSPSILNFSWLASDSCVEIILSKDNSFNLVLDLCSDMLCPLWGLISTGVCLSNQLNLLQISCTNISTMISGNRKLNFELNDKGYEYLSTCNFLVYLCFNKSSKFPPNTFFTLSWWGVCRILMEKLNKYILE